MSDNSHFDDFMDFKLSNSNNGQPPANSGGCSIAFWIVIAVLLLVFRVVR